MSFLSDMMKIAIDAGNPSISRPVTDYAAQIAQLQAQLDALPTDGGFYTNARRGTLLVLINDAKRKQAQANLNNGITPPAAPAPVLGQRPTTPKVGIDALKLLLPTS